jgi:hypothetical protein
MTTSDDSDDSDLDTASRKSMHRVASQRTSIVDAVSTICVVGHVAVIGSTQTNHCATSRAGEMDPNVDRTASENDDASVRQDDDPRRPRCADTVDA